MRYTILALLLCGCVTTQTPTVYTAAQYNGLNERTNRQELTELMGVDPVRYEWCAAFVNSILHLNDIPGTDSLLARSFLDWGEKVTDEPQRGDIVVFPRGNQGWQGHVGFYVDTRMVDGITYYLILGGNQDNSVSYELYPAWRALSVRRFPE
jgi:uncharacterized protein (TIGR02594 family)